MKPIDPDVPRHKLPPDARRQLIDHGLGNDETLPAIVTPHGFVITRWQLTAHELERLLSGEDLYLTIWAAGVLNPMRLHVGVIDWSREGKFLSDDPNANLPDAWKPKS